jgi:hypothetical protein
MVCFPFYIKAEKYEGRKMCAAMRRVVGPIQLGGTNLYHTATSQLIAAEDFVPLVHR